METLKSCPFEDPVGKYKIEKQKKQITEFEWLQSCTEEELVKVLSDAMWYGEQCATEGALCENCKCPWCNGISKWLRQPHTDKE